MEFGTSPSYQFLGGDGEMGNSVSIMALKKPGLFTNYPSPQNISQVFGNYANV